MPDTFRSNPQPSDLLGREREVCHLIGVLDRVAAGSGTALTVIGPPGAGKSRLLDEAASLAACRGIETVRISGLQCPSDLPWAGIAELCAPFADRLAADGSVRSAALRSALALDVAVQPIDGLAVALGALDLLLEVGADAPVLVLVDDLQWIDAESRSALSFIVRRLGNDRVALVAAARPDPADRSVVVGAELDLDALDDAAIGAVLARHGVRAPLAVTAITALASGNPLMAKRLADGLSPEERSGSRPVPTSLRVPDDVEELYRPLIAALDEPAALAVAVVAADTVGEMGPVSAALQRLDLGVADLEPAEMVGLVRVDGSRVGFAHPLARSAAYQVLPPPYRRRAHLALAALEGPGSPAGILHRASAATGADEELAADLAKLGEDAGNRGAPLAAANLLAQAAGLSPGVDDRADRLVAAARAALAAGEPAWASELLEGARAADPTRTGRLEGRSVAVQLMVANGHREEARRLAEEADVALSSIDPAGVAAMLAEVARPMLVEAPLEVGAIADRMWELAQAAAGPPSLYVEVLYGCARFLQGDAEGASLHAGRWRELLDRDGPVIAGPFLANTALLYLGYSAPRGDTLAVLDEIEGSIRASLATGALVPVLAARSFLSYGVDLRACVASGREALTLSEETGQSGLMPVALSTLSIAAATVGDEELTMQAADRLLASGSEWGEVWARAALGRLRLVHNRPDEAVAQFEMLRARIGGENRTFTQFEADAAEAYIRAGRPGDAQSLLPALEADAEARGAWSVGQLHRIRALLAPDIDAASVEFGIAHDALAETDNKIAQGIVELTWGEWLRRAKRRAEARRHLEQAVELFGLVGATGMRRRAVEELVGAGGTTDRSRPTDELLGPIELRVARLAAAGQTNRTIADALFISPRTVENRLGAVYRKLGVAGRSGLAARAATDPVLRACEGA